MKNELINIDAPVSEGRIIKYKVFCRICGKLQIRNINLKKTICFKCSREEQREYNRKKREKNKKVL